MNLTVYIVQNVVLCVAFGALVLGLQFRDSSAFVSDYPPVIQERYYRTQHIVPAAPIGRHSRGAIARKAAAAAVAMFLCALMARMAGAATFAQSLCAVYGYLFVIMVFDTCIIDWVVFANVRRLRLPGTEDMDRAYHQKWFHIKVLAPAVPPLLACGVLSALISSII